jgi:hypothetical protein|tara:strand:- start:82 stop:321 length:240 start_codon:yes stop_codon:yes gene_type:complete
MEQTFKLTKSDLSERSSNKAFAKIAMLKFEVDSLANDVKTGSTGGITMEELCMVYEGAKVELQVWNYISELIEKNNKLT